MILARCLAVSVILLFFAGCVSKPPAPEVQQLTKASKPICRIAVLPFINHTDYLQGDTILYRIFVAELNRLGAFMVVQEGDVRKVLRHMKLSPKESPGHEQTKILADRLGVDAMISGEIITMHEESGSKETKPHLAVDLKLTQAGSPQPMLTLYHRRSGEDYRQILHFGLVNTMTALAAQVSQEILSTWLSQGLTPCAL